VTVTVDETLRRVLDEQGREVAAPPKVPDDDLRALHRHLLKMRLLDTRMLSLQRQGRIGFYGMATGQEASITGSAYPLEPGDWIFHALRETGVCLWRGDDAPGDRLPVDRQLRRRADRPPDADAFQRPQGELGGVVERHRHAAPAGDGAAYAAKLLKHDTVCVGYIGDGGTSTGDFHAA